MTDSNPNLDLANKNAFLKFGEIPSICSQDIELKQNFNQGLYLCNNPNLDLNNINSSNI